MRRAVCKVVSTAFSIVLIGLTSSFVVNANPTAGPAPGRTPGAVSAAPVSAPDGASPSITAVDLRVAESMAEQCLVQHHIAGWPAFSFVVVDAAGSPVLLRRQDGASPVTADAALLKARTAARFGAPTQVLVAMGQDAPTRDLMLLLQVTDDPGGVPLKVGGRIIGAIGVSGGTADQDVGCATVAANVVSAEKK